VAAKTDIWSWRTKDLCKISTVELRFSVLADCAPPCKTLWFLTTVNKASSKEYARETVLGRRDSPAWVTHWGARCYWWERKYSLGDCTGRLVEGSKIEPLTVQRNAMVTEALGRTPAMNAIVVPAMARPHEVRSMNPSIDIGLEPRSHCTFDERRREAWYSQKKDAVGREMRSSEHLVACNPETVQAN